MFRSCSALISKCNTHTALYVLPYVVLHVLQDGSEQDIEEVVVILIFHRGLVKECIDNSGIIFLICP